MAFDLVTRFLPFERPSFPFIRPTEIYRLYWSLVSKTTRFVLHSSFSGEMSPIAMEDSVEELDQSQPHKFHSKSPD